MTTCLSNAEAAALYRQHFELFAHKCFEILNQGKKLKHNWHITAMAELLENCRTGSITRAIINLPPRSLKSQMVSVIFAAYVAAIQQNR